ncbi:carbohydrate binding domain-containing protein [bacterium]|nr:carbohydrate binding domain-containing protein [bacterium]
MRALILLVCLVVLSSVRADVPAGWFPFVIGEINPASPLNMAEANAVPAGQNGFVRVKDGHFVDGRGQRLRFLGTNVTFATAFPDKALAPLIAKRMAAIGFNVVRFHHMDCHYKPSGIWDKAYKDKQHMDAEQLDRLDWFIYQLKQNGIYVNLNLHVSRTLGKDDGFVEDNTLGNYDKGLDNFVAGMIQKQREYARDLLTHENPYTKTRYINEPCVLLVEMNNENSLLGSAFSSKLNDIAEPYKAELTGYWHGFLKGKYQTTEALRKAWDEGSQPLGEELLRNRDLAQGTKEWVLESKHPGEDVFEVVDDAAVGKALHAKLVQLGVNPWDFQVHQVGHNLTDGQVYTLRFQIKAEPKRDVNVSVRWDVADWRNSGLDTSVKADTQWREFTFAFRARNVNPNHVRISFNGGNTLGDMWIGGVSLRIGGIVGLGEGQTLEAGNIPFASANATQAAQRDWAACIMGLERQYTQGLYQYLKQDLGLQANVIDTQASYGGLGGAWRESKLDYVDNHSYWQHPSFPGRPWDGANWFIGNSPMSDAPGNDTLTALARGRQAGKPYTISEYDHPAPSDYRAEGLPMLAAFAGLQDWDGLFQFDYGSTPTDWSQARLQGYFTMVSDPAVVAFAPVAANLFRRGDVHAATGLAKLRVPESQVEALVAEARGDFHGLWEKAGLPRWASVRQRIALEWTKSGELRGDKLDVAEDQQSVSDTREVRWGEVAPEHKAFLVDAPKTKLAAGRLADQTLQWGALTIKPTPGQTGHCVVALTSLGNLPLAQSKRMLLVAASRVENQNMQWDERRRTVSNKWGTGPTIAEQVTLNCTAGRALKITPLDGAGMPLAGVTPQQGKQLTLQAPTLWYLVEVQ